MKKKICFVAQFPPPIHGLSKAIDTLYNSELNEEFQFTKIDTSDNKRFFKTIFFLLINNSDLFYFTISQSKFGNLRDLIILKILRLLNKKCVIHLHGGYYRHLVDYDLNRWQRKINYNEIKRIEGAIVLSDSLKEIFEGMIDERKIFVVPNGVDKQYLISSIDYQKKLRNINQKKEKHILYLSNLIRSKGYPKVLEMAKLEKNRCFEMDAKNPLVHKRFHFDFAGAFFDEKEKKYFFSFIKENELQDFVSYHGIVNGEQKKDLLMSSDIFVLLTRYPNEGQPISILEAMGNGMVVISTNHAGIPDIVKDGVNGIIFKESDGLEKLFIEIDKLNFETIIVNNRNAVLENYLQEKYIGNMRERFLDLL